MRQNKGFGELVSGRLDFHLFFTEYTRILPFVAVKINAKIAGIFVVAPVQIYIESVLKRINPRS